MPSHTVRAELVEAFCFHPSLRVFAASREKVFAREAAKARRGGMLTLTRHPDTPCEALSAIEVEAARTEHGQLVVHYRLRGDIRAVRLPAPVRYAMQVDGLWQHTCLEAFISCGSLPAYVELNFSPSTAWAAYIFTAYRAGSRAAVLDPPPLDVEACENELNLTAAVDMSALSELRSDRPWKAGLSAVIEETSGRKSYWALAHPAVKPDFHHPHSFVLTLPEPA